MMRALRTLAVVGFAAVASIANAGIVTQFSYVLVSSWSSATFTNGSAPVIPGPSPADTSVSASVLSWGIPATLAGQSSLSITNPAPGSLVNTFIGGGTPPPIFAAAGSTLTHANNPIFAPFLTGATLTASITLTPLVSTTPPPPPPGPPFTLSPPLVLSISFVETPNVTPCAATSPPGNPCNDIFVLNNPTFLNQTFSLMGQTYFVNVFPAALGVLSTLEPSACAAAGKAPGCVGFTTEEGLTTRLPFAFTISTQPLGVPEPSVLALFALGLVGLGFTMRRRQA